MALFRPYERKTEQSGRESHQRTRLVPETGKKTAASPTEKEKKSPEAQETSIPKTETHHTSSHGSSKVKVPRRQPVRKSEPTLTRKQAEAARMQRLHPNLTPKEQRKADREAQAKARIDAWDKVEASPERVLARDYVDTRWTITEFMFPAMILIMAGTMATAQWPLISVSIGLGLWVMLILSFINTWFMWRGFKRLLLQRVPRANLRGLLMYMFNRSLMIRRFRRPTPRINRGETI
ncbi:DUF3043 domain-containing protein [Arachnia propionica]|uniref:DUF3043 domain-containing protein n=1 Tax=Arachnia propionica TaxID=1750 RepID=UPI0030D1F27B